MEPQKRCISYWVDPRERCKEPTEKKFCKGHISHVKHYLKYKKISFRGLIDYSLEVIIRLKKEIDAREKFMKKAVCIECRDRNHVFWIDFLKTKLKEAEFVYDQQNKIVSGENLSALPISQEPKLAVKSHTRKPSRITKTKKRANPFPNEPTTFELMQKKYKVCLLAAKKTGYSVEAFSIFGMIRTVLAFGHNTIFFPLKYPDVQMNYNCLEIGLMTLGEWSESSYTFFPSDSVHVLLTRIDTALKFASKLIILGNPNDKSTCWSSFLWHKIPPEEIRNGFLFSYNEKSAIVLSEFQINTKLLSKSSKSIYHDRLEMRPSKETKYYAFCQLIIRLRIISCIINEKRDDMLASEIKYYLKLINFK